VDAHFFHLSMIPISPTTPVLPRFALTAGVFLQKSSASGSLSSFCSRSSNAHVMRSPFRRTASASLLTSLCSFSFPADVFVLRFSGAQRYTCDQRPRQAARHARERLPGLHRSEPREQHDAGVQVLTVRRVRVNPLRRSGPLATEDPKRSFVGCV
jgi:hypothetical protein